MYHVGPPGGLWGPHLGQEPADVILSRLHVPFRGREAAALLTAPSGQDLAAGRARGVGPQPRVDASGVESVAALRKHANFFSLGELRQADGAVGRQPLLAGAGEGELGEGSDHLLLQALVGRDLTLGVAAGGGGRAADPGAAGHEG